MGYWFFEAIFEIISHPTSMGKLNLSKQGGIFKVSH